MKCLFNFLSIDSSPLLPGHALLCRGAASFGPWRVLFSHFPAGRHLLGNLPNLATVRAPSAQSISVFLTLSFIHFFSHLSIQGLCVAAALRDGRPGAALALHRILSDTLDAGPPQSHQTDGSVSSMRCCIPCTPCH